MNKKELTKLLNAYKREMKDKGKGWKIEIQKDEDDYPMYFAILTKGDVEIEYDNDGFLARVALGPPSYHQSEGNWESTPDKALDSLRDCINVEFASLNEVKKELDRTLN